MKNNGCQHYEVITHEPFIDDKGHTRYRTLGTCKHCRQVREFPDAVDKHNGRIKKAMPVIIKEGTMSEPVMINQSEDAETKETEGGKRGGATRMKGRFYDEHKEEIIADLQELGLEDMRKKWAIPLTSWYGLQKRWGLVKQANARYEYTPPEGQPKPVLETTFTLPNDTLQPEFPPFNDNWADDVKVLWLYAYGRVFGR